jgi:uncharacterized membrane protein YhaH (DUF805 family)
VKGNVIGFDADTNTGAISGHDGNRYDFARLDWRGHNQPQHGDIVDFQAIGQRAQDIYLLAPEYVRPSFWQFYFSPRGRISRSQYWLRFVLPLFVISIILAILKAINGETATDKGPFSTVTVVFQLVTLWPGIAILVKRIHDRNKSGWLAWLLYGPLIVAFIFTIITIVVIFTSSESAAWGPGIVAGLGWLVTLVVSIWFFVEFGCMRGTIGGNRFGADPVPHS